MLEWGDSVLRKGKQMKYAFIKTNKAVFKITSMYRVFKVKASSYYGWSNVVLANNSNTVTTVKYSLNQPMKRKNSIMDIKGCMLI